MPAMLTTLRRQAPRQSLGLDESMALRLPSLTSQHVRRLLALRRAKLYSWNESPMVFRMALPPVQLFELWKILLRQNLHFPARVDGTFYYFRDGPDR